MVLMVSVFFVVPRTTGIYSIEKGFVCKFNLVVSVVLVVASEK